MQQNDPSMSVAGLKKMMHIWKSRNITDSTTTKLLELYLGLTAYMNSQKIYPQENFYEIRNSLRFSTTQALIEAMKRSQAFPFVTDPETGAVKAFWSPLYHETNSEIHTEKDNGPASQTFAPTDNNNINNNNIYTNSTNERTSFRSSSPEKDSPKDDSGNLSEENFPGQGNSTTDTLPTIAAKEFFHRINTSKEEKAGILIPLIDRFQQQEGIDRPQACRIVVCLVNEKLIPYFTAQVKFRKLNHTGRLAWLANLLKSAHGQNLIAQAIQSHRTKREQEVRENCRKQCSELRSFHPVSPHEWSDRESGSRFYDDATEGTVLIPAEAAPRPSEKAVWNVLSHLWNE